MRTFAALPEAPETNPVIQKAQASVGTGFDVKARVYTDQIFSLLRVIGILVSGITALLAYLPTRDLAGALEFVRSSPDLIPAAVTVAGLATIAYGNLRTRWRKQQLIVAGNASPNVRVVE